MKTLLRMPRRMWIDGQTFFINPLSEKYKINKSWRDNKASPSPSPRKNDKRKFNLQRKSEAAVPVPVPSQAQQSGTEEPSQTESCVCGDPNKAQENCSYSISPKDDQKLFTQFRLPSLYYIRLLNSPLELLEAATNTKIEFPKHGQDGNISITGTKNHEICKARTELHAMIADIRDSLRALQFISLPVLNEDIRAKFEKLKEDILSEETIPGVHESIFISPLKLHLTVDVFVLLDKTEKAEAIKTLEEYKRDILSPFFESFGPLQLKVAGLECMEDNLKKAHVLYAKAKLLNETEENNLQKLVNDISRCFYNKGFVLRHQENVKLHMTLMNTKYRNISGSQGTPKKRWVKREPFDATKILEKYGDYEFGVSNLESIHLSMISTVGDDGFYKPLSTISIP